MPIDTIQRNAVLSAEQGPYEWKVRDCLTTLEKWEPRANRIAISAWHEYEHETDAIAAAQNQLGSLSVGYAILINKPPAPDKRIGPGSIVVYSILGGLEYMGFCPSLGVVYGWTATGLRPIHIPSRSILQVY